MGKNVRERGRISALLRPLRFYCMLMDMVLSKFNIYESPVAPNCFKTHKNS